VFEARWDVQVDDKSSFALILFCGLIVFTFFADMVNQAPNLILNNPAYVKKIVFPLDCLVWVGILTSLFNLLTSFSILLAVDFLTDWYINWTTIFFPLLLPPLALLTLGVSLVLASLGVFLRDISQITGVATTFILFMSPIFYPITAIPESLRKILSLNPLAPLIAEARRVVIWGELPNWQTLGLVYLVSLIVAWCGFYWFQKTRKGFADVL
jgi:lipopolysaccharide transport system permease protein